MDPRWTQVDPLSRDGSELTKVASCKQIFSSTGRTEKYDKVGTLLGIHCLYLHILYSVACDLYTVHLRVFFHNFVLIYSIFELFLRVIRCY